MIIRAQNYTTTKKNKMEMEDGKKSLLEKKHFVLVHGACHGAWCWYKLATLLRSAGHRVTALDLAASGVDPKQVNDLQSFSDYHEPLMKFMEYSLLVTTDEERVVLVGHSMGGLSISKVMESFPEKISIAVFISALMPGPTFDVSTIMQEYMRRRGSIGDSKYSYDDGPDKSPTTTFIFGPNYLSSNLYQLCPPEDLSLATMLVRPIRLFSEEEMSNEIMVSQEKYGSVRRTYVICDEDKAISKDLQIWMIQNNPTDGVKEIVGSDHTVMLSKPQELFACLREIADEPARIN